MMTERSDLTELTLSDAASGVAAGDVSPVALVTACLQQMEAGDGALKAFISVQRKSALAAAYAAEAMAVRGRLLGPLHGVPLAVKDNLALAGVPCTAGSRILSEWVPRRDATAVARLKSAGAIVLGKTNLHEFAYGGSGANPHFGHVQNPWQPGTDSGGSSSGSAAAVAARFCYGALGTDTGGSVRLPAAMTGLVGLRPTQGRVSNHGAIPLAGSMDTVGPMTRTVEDNALLLSVLAGHDAQDDGSSTEPAGDYMADLGRGLEGLSLGVARGYNHERVQSAVEEAFEQALATFEGEGATVSKVDISGLELAPGAKQLIQASEAAAYHDRWLRKRPQAYGQDVRTRLQAGSLITATHYVQARRYAAALHRRCLEVLRTVDALVSPTMGFTALPYGERRLVIDGEAVDAAAALGTYMALASLTGLPALTLPCGFDQSGLPIGLQIVGPPLGERLLYRIAAAFQRATDFHRASPSPEWSAVQEE